MEGREKNEWSQKNGCWEKNGVIYPRVARIRPDKLLKTQEFRGLFHPNDMVHYCENLIFKEEVGDGVFIYLASVKPVEGDEAKCSPIPLGLLEFTPEQKSAIIKKTGFPKSAFEKLPSRIKDEEVFDEPIGVESFYLGDDYL